MVDSGRGMFGGVLFVLIQENLQDVFLSTKSKEQKHLFNMLSFAFLNCFIHLKYMYFTFRLVHA